MSRRANRRRRERRRERDRVLPNPGPPDMTLARARWTGFLATATAQGSRVPLFGHYVLRPVVESDWRPGRESD
jgi:hypothetical protein